MLPSISEFFKALEKETDHKYNISPISIHIKNDEGEFECYYGFHELHSIRLELNREVIYAISLWMKPGNLNTPDYRIILKGVDALGEIDIVSRILSGKKRLLGESNHKILEDAADSVEKFMTSMGEYAYDKKLSELYQSYEQWAEVNNQQKLSNAYFFRLAKEFLVKNKKGKYKDVTIEKGSKEITEVNSDQESEFEKEVMGNQAFYKASLAEHTVKRIAQNDPLVNALFLCGNPGMGKSFMTRKTLESAGVMNRVVWKQGSIAGFTGLLQVLWDNRKNKILVLDDCDNLLTRKDQSTLNILKAALNTNQSDRVISYVRMRKGQ